MRVGILGLLHESNTFVRDFTTLAHFQEETLVTGEKVSEAFADAHHEIGGFLAGAKQWDMEAVPLFAARAVPFGTVKAEAIEHLLDMLERQLDHAGPLDGYLVAAHGAMVVEGQADGDGYWLSRLRQNIGPEIPIVGTLDLHANLSQQTVDACNALLAYRTNPHMDQRERGVEAASILARTLRGELRPVQAACMPPMATDIECQLTSRPPCRPIFDLAQQLCARPGVVATSVLLGFPYADVPQMGAATLCVANDDPLLAHQISQQLANRLWELREQFVGSHISVDQALQQAQQLEGPVCLLDMGDNVGGGSPGDGTCLAEAILQRRLGPSFVCLFDPGSVDEACRAGQGERLQLLVGGKTDDRHGAPLEIDCTVIALHDGRFDEPETRHGGMKQFDQGRTAVVLASTGMTVMLTSRRMPPFSLRQLTSCGIDPAQFRLIVAKGVNAPVAAYQPVCRHFIQVDTPGVTRADMTQLPYVHRRRPMFPFEVLAYG